MHPNSIAPDNSMAAELLAVIEILREIVSAGLDRDAVCELVVQRAKTLTHATGGVVELVDGDEMVYHKASGTAVHSVGMRISRSTSLSGRCVEQRIVLRSDDTEIDPRVNAEACRKVGVASMLCVPLIHADRVVGVLKVLSSNKHAFNDFHASTLSVLADVIAASMANAERFSEANFDRCHDPLTGLFNRRAYDEELQVEVARAQRHNRTLTLALLDLDGFKAVNDLQGHPAGDSVLRHVASVLTRSVRLMDRCFRIGGDEFAILLPETTLVKASTVARRIEKGVTVLSSQLAEHITPVHISISVGMVELIAMDEAEALHSAADQKLYQAKLARKSHSRDSVRTFPVH